MPYCLCPVLEKSREGLWSVTAEFYLCTFQPERAVSDLTQFSELSTRWFCIMAVVVNDPCSNLCNKIPSFLHRREILSENFQRFYKIVPNKDADSAFKMKIHLCFSLLL